MTTDQFWLLGLKLVSTIAGVTSLFFTIRNQVRRSRQALKIDLEILNLLKDEKMCSLIEKNVRTRVERLYEKPDADVGGPWMGIYNRPLFVFGCFMLVGFSIWATYLSWGKWNWWSVLPGFFALGGFGNILNAFQPARKVEADREAKVGSQI